ncbi:MAG: type IV secretion protein Rhs, partial [Micrococcales bacterium]|nr:type IV secretion protein Rhs [Micrococcales bacterium]
ASQSPEDLLEGEITALEAEFDGGGTFTVVRGYDQAHRLFRNRRTQSYLQVTAADVATEVAQRHGFTVGQIDATPTVFAHLSQAGQTDWELLSGLARDSGCEIT